MPEKIRGTKSGIALVTVVVFLIIISALAYTAVFIMTGVTRLSIHQVERMKASYAAEAGNVYNLDRFRRGLVPPANPAQPVTVTMDGKNYTATPENPAVNVNVGSSGQFPVTRLRSTVSASEGYSTP